ncbi:MAG: histidinol phosphate phosphatase domain-containing protein [PVC group bacterium]|nr:histidinol phosphate phosphatase domain-containing protein [PVC group bacterium]
MIDLHTHSMLSDGLLIPSELVRRAEVQGYKVLGITDHVDRSNIDFVIPRIKTVCEDLSRKSNIKVIAGIELTHIPPQDFLELVQYARTQGIALIVGHGETLAEPVIKGTNKAAIEAGVDILAHPGLITLEDAKLAAEKEVFLEISARKGHCLGNGNVAKIALQAGAKLILNTDTHAPEDLITINMASSIAQGAGLEADNIDEVLLKNPQGLVSRLTGVF